MSTTANSTATKGICFVNTVGDNKVAEGPLKEAKKDLVLRLSF